MFSDPILRAEDITGALVRNLKERYREGTPPYDQAEAIAALLEDSELDWTHIKYLNLVQILNAYNLLTSGRLLYDEAKIIKFVHKIQTAYANYSGEATLPSLETIVYEKTKVQAAKQKQEVEAKYEHQGICAPPHTSEPSKIDRLGVFGGPHCLN